MSLLVVMALLLDSGAYTIKAGRTGSEPTLTYNCVGKVRRSSLLTYGPSTLRGFHEVCRPIERGVLVDPKLQRKIWSRILKQTQPSDTALAMTVPIYTPKTTRRWIDEIVFEQFGFKSFVRRCTGIQGTALVLDLGFSSSTVIPIVHGFPVNYAAKRVDVGGKLLTNFLKREISFRYYDMTDETWLVSDIKEKTCRVSPSFLSDLRGYQSGKHPATTYVLPETHTDEGHIARPEEDIAGKQVLTLDNLCISTPELLFTPSDIGLNQGGIAQAVIESIERLDTSIYQDLLRNIILIGGSALFPGLHTRLYFPLRLSEITQLAHCESEVNITIPQE